MSNGLNKLEDSYETNEVENIKSASRTKERTHGEKTERND